MPRPCIIFGMRLAITIGAVAAALVGAAEKPPSADAKGKAELPFMHLPALGNPNASNSEITSLSLERMGITNLKPLWELTGLRELNLLRNPELPLTEVAKLQIALPRCEIQILLPLWPTVRTEIAIRRASGNLTNKLTQADYEKVHQLHLGGKRIGDLKPLAQLPKLERLFLNGNRVADLKPLAGLTNLTSLDLSDNPIPDDQIEMLERALRNCKIKFED